MAFLRTLLWIGVTAIVVVFSLRNWVPVTINLFGDMQADVKLPLLLLIAFLIGFLPLYAWHRAAMWRHARKLAVAARTNPLAPTTPSTPASAGTIPPVAVAPNAEPTQAD